MLYQPFNNAVASLKEAACKIFDDGISKHDSGLLWLQVRGLVSTVPHYYFDGEFALTDAAYDLIELGHDRVHRPLASWLPTDRKAA